MQMHNIRKVSNACTNIDRAVYVKRKFSGESQAVLLHSVRPVAVILYPKRILLKAMEYKRCTLQR